MQMAAQGVNTASLGNADQGSGFRVQRAENAQRPTRLRRGEHRTSNVQRSRRMFSVRLFDVQRSVFGVRCLEKYSTPPLLHYP